MVASCCGGSPSRNTSMRRGFEMNYGSMASDYDSMDDAVSAVVSQGGKFIESDRDSSGPLFYVYGSSALGYYKQALFTSHGRWHLGSVAQVNSIPSGAQSISTFMNNVRMARKDPRYSLEGCEDCIGIHTHTPIDAAAIAKAIRGSSENPRPFYRRRHYFDDIYEALVDRFNFTKRQATRALDMYRRDIHDYYNYGRPAGFTAGVIARYFPG